eukprot:jgi/Mesvir1/17303/Mv07702-RA.1
MQVSCEELLRPNEQVPCPHPISMHQGFGHVIEVPRLNGKLLPQPFALRDLIVHIQDVIIILRHRGLLPFLKQRHGSIRNLHLLSFPLSLQRLPLVGRKCFGESLLVRRRQQSTYSLLSTSELRVLVEAD